MNVSLNDGHRGRGGPALPDDRLDLPRHQHVGGVGHPVGDDGRLQGHHGTVVPESLGHLAADDEISRAETTEV